MIEKHLVLEDIDPVMFMGVGNVHLQMLRALYPKLRIIARDNVIRIMGDEEQMAAFEESTEKMRQHILKFNYITFPINIFKELSLFSFKCLNHI